MDQKDLQIIEFLFFIYVVHDVPLLELLKSVLKKGLL